MPVLTRSQAKRHVPLLLRLPEEVLSEIWKHVLAIAPHHDTHIRFKDYAPSSISYPSVDAVALGDNISHDLFRRQEFPEILLVSKHIYNSAKPFLYQHVSFTICMGACLQNFFELVPKDLIHKSTTFYCRIRQKDFRKETWDDIRRISTQKCSKEVNMIFRERSNTTQTRKLTRLAYTHRT